MLVNTIHNIIWIWIECYAHSSLSFYYENEIYFWIFIKFYNISYWKIKLTHISCNSFHSLECYSYVKTFKHAILCLPVDEDVRSLQKRVEGDISRLLLHFLIFELGSHWITHRINRLLQNRGNVGLSYRLNRLRWRERECLFEWILVTEIINIQNKENN